MIPSKRNLASIRENLHDLAVKNQLLMIEFDDRPWSGTTAVTFYGPSVGYPHYLIVWKDMRSIGESCDAIINDLLSRVKDSKEAAKTEIVTNRTKRKLSTQSFDISKVIFNDPATIVYWADGTKTVVKCQGDDWYSEEVGLAMCFMKKALGNKGNYNDAFRKWIPDTPSNPTVNIVFNGYTEGGYLDPNGLHKRIKELLDQTIGKREKGVSDS